MPSIERHAAFEISPRPASPVVEQRITENDAATERLLDTEHEPRAASERPVEAMPVPAGSVESVVEAPAPRPPQAQRPHRSSAFAPRAEAPVAPSHADGEDATVERGATAPQLRRFIKSRAYVPMHELRRRFVINGGDDDVTAVDVDRQRVFVGLPEREGRLLGELLRGGDIGYELSLDPISPIVVGVYPMRPVTRA
jgi:hypothetical protein